MNVCVAWVTAVWVPEQLSRYLAVLLDRTELRCAEMVPSAVITLMLHAKCCVCPCSEINVLLLMVFLGSSKYLVQGKK